MHIHEIWLDGCKLYIIRVCGLILTFHHEPVQAPDCDSCSSCCLHFLGGKWQEKKEKEGEGWKEEKGKQE